MEKVQFPRFMVAAEKSGQGKTLITCALLELLKEQHRVSALSLIHIYRDCCCRGLRGGRAGPDSEDPDLCSRRREDGGKDL